MAYGHLRECNEFYSAAQSFLHTTNTTHIDQDGAADKDFREVVAESSGGAPAARHCRDL